MYQGLPIIDQLTQYTQQKVGSQPLFTSHLLADPRTPNAAKFIQGFSELLQEPITGFDSPDSGNVPTLANTCFHWFQTGDGNLGLTPNLIQGGIFGTRLYAFYQGGQYNGVVRMGTSDLLDLPKITPSEVLQTIAEQAIGLMGDHIMDHTSNGEPLVTRTKQRQLSFLSVTCEQDIRRVEFKPIHPKDNIIMPSFIKFLGDILRYNLYYRQHIIRLLPTLINLGYPTVPTKIPSSQLNAIDEGTFPRNPLVRLLPNYK